MRSGSDVVGWLLVLHEVMARKKTPLSVKFDTELLARLDRFVERQTIEITRTSSSTGLRSWLMVLVTAGRL